MDNNLDKCEPVAWQFFKDGLWWYGNQDEYHKQKTVEAWLPIRNLYTSPQPIEKCEPVYLILSGADEIVVTKEKYDSWTSAKRIICTSPQPRDWVGLTDKRIEEIAKLNGAWQLYSSLKIFDFVANINDELKQLNTKG